VPDADGQAALTEQVLEIRYDRGYRYFDRCGEVMLILEDVLTKETNQLWMTGEIKVTGAHLKCPELEAVVVIDGKHLIVEQNPVTQDFDFKGTCRTVWAIVETRLGISTITRIGSRRKFTIPTNTFDEAEKLSVKYSPLGEWPGVGDTGFAPRGIDATNVFESADRKRGIRISLAAHAKLGTALQLD